MVNSSVNVDRVFRALGDGTRRAILDDLSRGRAFSTSDLARPLGITMAAVGQHLEIVEESRLVKTKKFGTMRMCWIASAGFDAVEKWVRDVSPVRAALLLHG